VALLRVGDCFGEHSAMTGAKCGASIRAKEALELLAMPRPQLLDLIERFPMFGQRLHSIEGSRMREDAFIQKYHIGGDGSTKKSGLEAARDLAKAAKDQAEILKQAKKMAAHPRSSSGSMSHRLPSRMISFVATKLHIRTTRSSSHSVRGSRKSSVQQGSRGGSRATRGGSVLNDAAILPSHADHLCATFAKLDQDGSAAVTRDSALPLVATDPEVPRVQLQSVAEASERSTNLSCADGETSTAQSKLSSCTVSMSDEQTVSSVSVASAEGEGGVAHDKFASRSSEEVRTVEDLEVADPAFSA